MSKLTNCQIEATIRGLQGTAKRKAEQHDKGGTRRALAKLLAYQWELQGRLAAGENPGTEIQGVRHGE